jgi:hypothetical protein
MFFLGSDEEKNQWIATYDPCSNEVSFQLFKKDRLIKRYRIPFDSIKAFVEMQSDVLNSLSKKIKGIINDYKGVKLISIQCVDNDNFCLIYGFLVLNGFSANKGIGSFSIEVTGIDYEDDESLVTWKDLVHWVIEHKGDFR